MIYFNYDDVYIRKCPLPVPDHRVQGGGLQADHPGDVQGEETQ